MRYVVTFDNCDGSYESITIDAPYMEYAIMEAKEKMNEINGYNYCDSDVLSVVRV